MMKEVISSLLGIFSPNATRKKKVKVDYFRHEALHTTSMLSEMVADHLVEHHYYHSGINPEFNEKVDEAISTLMAAYSLVNEDHELFKKIDNPFYIDPLKFIPEYSESQFKLIRQCDNGNLEVIKT